VKPETVGGVVTSAFYFVAEFEVVMSDNPYEISTEEDPKFSEVLPSTVSVFFGGSNQKYCFPATEEGTTI